MTAASTRLNTTLHDDDAHARSQGLPGIIADGMLSTNWLLSLLPGAFGEGALAPGGLRTCYVAPVFGEAVITPSPGWRA
ncbi:hotdog family protein [Muricoccus vinaceus]|uniref:Uncharacterized protein n=1 Tax=Muricoccus vinaceus TaxID=424704 RepID=A0ABV6IQL0_9PROT